MQQTHSISTAGKNCGKALRTCTWLFWRLRSSSELVYPWSPVKAKG